MLPNYSILALDLDGTLLNPVGELTARTITAVARAQDAGMRVVVCTGRGLAECRRFLETLNLIAPDTPAIVAGGSITADAATGATTHRFSMDPELVGLIVTELLAHDHAALVFKDASGIGYDYLTIHGDRALPLHPVTTWWMEKHAIPCRSAEGIESDEHPEHTVRVGACANAHAFRVLQEVLREKFADQVALQHFRAVTADHYLAQHANARDERSCTPVPRSVHILEVFHPRANKWAALQELALRTNTPAQRIAAIGDEVNDLEMIRCAGLGVAMGNATPAVKAVAKRETRSHEHDGAAIAIERIAEGEW